MLSFSQRKGLKPVRDLIQIDSADERLRNALWNILYLVYLKANEVPFYSLDDNCKPLFISLWIKHYGRRYDELPSHTQDIILMIKDHHTRTMARYVRYLRVHPESLLCKMGWRI